MVLSAYCKGKACHLNWIKIEIVAATARTHAVCFIYLFTAIRGKVAFLNGLESKVYPDLVSIGLSNILALAVLVYCFPPTALLI